MLSLERVIKGPYGTEIKVGVPVIGILLVLGAFIKWQRPAMGILYTTIDFLLTNKLAIIFAGTTSISLGLLAPNTKPELRKGNISILFSVLALAGILAVGLAFLSPLMHSVPRWAGPSIGLLHEDSDSGKREAISRVVDHLGAKLDSSVELRQIGARREDLPKTLADFARYQHDVVILDYDQPLQVRGDKPSTVLNPRTLYLLLRPGDPDQQLPPNVVSLSPPVVEEVNALMRLLSYPTKPVQIVRRNTARGNSAAELLRHALAVRGVSIKPDLVDSDIASGGPKPGDVFIWLGWRRLELPDGSVVDRPSVLKVTPSGAIEATSIAALPFLTGSALGGDIWSHNQMLALEAIFDAHFLQARRPLDTRKSVNAAVQRLAEVHLATVSRDLRLVPRYSDRGATE